MKRVVFIIAAAPFCIVGAIFFFCGVLCFAPLILLCPALEKDHAATPAPMDAM